MSEQAKPKATKTIKPAPAMPAEGVLGFRKPYASPDHKKPVRNRAVAKTGDADSKPAAKKPHRNKPKREETPPRPASTAQLQFLAAHFRR
jgi:hypothetical protein